MAKAKTRKAPRQPWQGDSDKARTLREWGINSRSSAEEVRAATSRYRREYTAFSKRVANYNAATGSKYSASRMFYNYQRLPARDYSVGMRGILATPATQSKVGGKSTVVTANVERIAKDTIYNLWSGAIAKSPTIAKYWESYQKGEITLSKFNTLAAQWSSDIKTERKGDPTIGSP